MQNKTLTKARHHIQVSNFILSEESWTYIKSLEEIFLAFNNALENSLSFEKEEKNIEIIGDRFENRLTIFSRNLRKKYKIPEEDIALIRELREILIKHKKSPIEFSKKERYIICDEKYHFKTLRKEEIILFRTKAKFFIEQVEKVLNHGNVIV